MGVVGPRNETRPRFGLDHGSIRPTRPKQKLRRGMRVRRNRHRFTRLIASTLLLATVVVLLWPARAAWERHRAWDRIGSCAADGESTAVSCSGVALVDVVLPDAFAACTEIRPLNAGACTVQVNREVYDRFTAAVAEVDAAGLGRHVTSFGTVNRRRCKDAITGAFIPGCISKHSYGLAADVRSFGDNAKWDEVVEREPGVQRMIDIFRSNGFTWGMSFRSNPDPQHVEWTP